MYCRGGLTRPSTATALPVGAGVPTAVTGAAACDWCPGAGPDLSGDAVCSAVLAAAEGAGPDDVDVVPVGEPDADITGLADASTEREEADVESNPDDADDDPEEDFVLDGDPDADVAELVDAPADACVDDDAEDSTEPEEPDVESDPDDADELFDDDREGEDESLESDVSACATPCPVTAAAPTPKATASPPTRPT